MACILQSLADMDFFSMAETIAAFVACGFTAFVVVEYTLTEWWDDEWEQTP